MHRRAFSLLELSVVIVVAGVAAAVAVPRFMGSTSHTRLQAAAMRMAQDLEATREKARTLGVYQTVCFSNEGYVIVDRTPDTEVKRTISLANDPYACQIAWVALATGSELNFDGFGVPSTAAKIKITNGNQVYLVSVAPGSGAVTVSPRMNKPQGDALDPQVTPIPMPTGVAAIVPPVRVVTKVRYGSTSFDASISVIELVDEIK